MIKLNYIVNPGLAIQQRLPRKSNLTEELENLRKQYSRTEDTLARMYHEFWDNGGICCPSCGCEGYSELQLKQERRVERIRQIKEKLAKNVTMSTGIKS